ACAGAFPCERRDPSGFAGPGEGLCSRRSESTTVSAVVSLPDRRSWVMPCRTPVRTALRARRFQSMLRSLLGPQGVPGPREASLDWVVVAGEHASRLAGVGGDGQRAQPRRVEDPVDAASPALDPPVEVEGVDIRV